MRVCCHIPEDVAHADRAGGGRRVSRDGAIDGERFPRSPVVVLAAAPEDEVGEHLALAAARLGGARARTTRARSRAALTGVVLGVRRSDAQVTGIRAVHA